MLLVSWWKYDCQDVFHQRNAFHTFDELPDGHLEDQELIKEADKHRTFNDDEMYQYYGYLVEEELHPCLFPVDLENPEELPDDISIHIDTEE